MVAGVVRDPVERLKVGSVPLATIKLLALVSVPPIPVTVMGPVPAPTGTATVIVFPPETLTTLVLIPLNSTTGLVPKL
jgi:hypothetical protein